MTTPKSPEQIMEELREITQPYCASGCGCFEDGIPGHEGSCVTKCSTFEEQKAWLRSSMASLLCYMAERMGKKEHIIHDGIFPAVAEHAANNTIDDCRTLLIEEARKILDK